MELSRGQHRSPCSNLCLFYSLHSGRDCCGAQFCTFCAWVQHNTLYKTFYSTPVTFQFLQSHHYCVQGDHFLHVILSYALLRACTVLRSFPLLLYRFATLTICYPLQIYLCNAHFFPVWPCLNCLILKMKAL